MNTLAVICVILAVALIIFVFALAKVASRESPQPPSGPIDWDGYKNGNNFFKVDLRFL